VPDGEQEEREERQLALMIDRLDRFSSGQLSIGPVINDLEALVYELELVDDGWRREFIESWSGLEIPYAVALDRAEPVPTADDDTVREALVRLRELVTERLTALASWLLICHKQAHRLPDSPPLHLVGGAVKGIGHTYVR
jgi:hypothetical protein